MKTFKNNIHDVALIFEGGGMRNSYSSGASNAMLDYEFFFDAVYALSAGATNAINYLSRDRWRSEASFTEKVDDLDFKRSIRFLLKLAGSLLHEDYSVDAVIGESLPFDFESFSKNPANLTLEALSRDSGISHYFTSKDYSSETLLMKRVRASTSYPIIMSPTWVDGTAYYDGGIGEGGGIMLPRAETDGFERFFVIRTKPRGFRKPLKRNRIYDVFFWHRPHMREELDTWARRYNEQLDRLDELEREGRAYIFYAADQSVSNTERNIAKLKDNYQKGYRQALSELDAWSRFLGI